MRVVRCRRRVPVSSSNCWTARETRALAICRLSAARVKLANSTTRRKIFSHSIRSIVLYFETVCHNIDSLSLGGKQVKWTHQEHEGEPTDENRRHYRRKPRPGPQHRSTSGPPGSGRGAHLSQCPVRSRGS